MTQLINMRFNIISSGSKGNTSVVIYKKTAILIDMGVSFSCLESGLEEMGLKVEDLSAALFTHNHSDHINGIRFLSPKIMYALEGTLPGTLSHVIELNKEFDIGDFKITAFKTSHDAINPCGYLLKAGDETLVYMTDTGCFLEENLALIKDPTYLVIESNHDIKMLLATKRTYELKNRILSDVGHLCNEDSAIAATQIIGKDTKEIILAHLSEEANTPELALAAYLKVFKHFGINSDNYLIRCAHQHHSTIGGHKDED